MRQSWTDERLDDFRGEVNRRFDAIHDRFDSLQRSMLQASAVLIVALLGMLGTQL